MFVYIHTKWSGFIGWMVWRALQVLWLWLVLRDPWGGKKTGPWTKKFRFSVKVNIYLKPCIHLRSKMRAPQVKVFEFLKSCISKSEKGRIMNWPPPKKYNLFFIEQPTLKLKILSAPPKTQNSKISANPLTLRGCILCCRPFPQDLGQVQAHIILYFTKIKTVCFMISCLTILVSYLYRGQQGRVLKLQKNVKL